MDTLLREEIQSELEGLNGIDLGTDEYRTTVDGITKLMDRAIEIDRLNIEVQDREDNREHEKTLRLSELKEECKDRKVRNAISIAGIVIPTVVTIWGTLKSFKFEEDGTITTIMGRGFINKLLPRK